MPMTATYHSYLDNSTHREELRLNGEIYASRVITNLDETITWEGHRIPFLSPDYSRYNAEFNIIRTFLQYRPMKSFSDEEKAAFVVPRTLDSIGYLIASK